MWPVLEPRGPLGVKGGWSVSPGGVGTDVGVVVILLTPVGGGVAGPPTYIHIYKFCGFTGLSHNTMMW